MYNGVCCLPVMAPTDSLRVWSRSNKLAFNGLRFGQVDGCLLGITFMITLKT